MHYNKYTIRLNIFIIINSFLSKIWGYKGWNSKKLASARAKSEDME